MSADSIKLAVVGVGKIVRDQHLPAIYGNDQFSLVAAASRNATVDDVANFKTIEELVDGVPELEAVALCMPPQSRFEAAKTALNAGLHVLLEKPPGATVAEVEQLSKIADDKGCTLFTTWHSRYAAAVDQARGLLENARINSVRIDWKEDVRKWHPGQDWIWQAGGLGVFDPGINGLSILTEVLPEAVYVSHSRLSFPENKAAPIAAEISCTTPMGVLVEIEFDWGEIDREVWDIDVRTEQGDIRIAVGGASLYLHGSKQNLPETNEYAGIYRHFAELINNRISLVDLAPLKLAADAFLLGDRVMVEAFED